VVGDGRLKRNPLLLVVFHHTPELDGYAGSPFFMGSGHREPSQTSRPTPVPWYPILASAQLTTSCG